MSLTIRQKLAACLAGILAVFILTGGYEVVTLKDELVTLEKAKGDIAKGFNKVMPLELVVKDIRFHAVQVQQWLTDISATRGMDGLNDGFDTAKAHRAEFEQSAAAAKALAKELNLGNVVTAIQAAEAAVFQSG